MESWKLSMQVMQKALTTSWFFLQLGRAFLMLIVYYDIII